MILEARKSYDKKLHDELCDVEVTDSKSVFSLLKKHLPNCCRVIPPMTKSDGSVTESNIENCTVINEGLIQCGIGVRPNDYDHGFADKIKTEIVSRLSFLRKQNDERDKESPLLAENDLDAIEADRVITAKMLEPIIKKLKTGKSCGPDGVRVIMLKEGGEYLRVCLALLFTKLIQEAVFPVHYKRADVAVLYKGGGKDPTCVGSYRPISLTSILCKVFETLLRNKLYDALEARNFFPSYQFGFRKGRGCTEALLYMYESWLSKLRKGECSYVNVVLTDISKCFDRVCRTSLLYKLWKEAGVDGNLLLLIADFLADRKQRVVIKGEFSDWLNNDMGTPQGAVLSVTLFLVFAATMMEDIPCDKSGFADDCGIWATHKKEEDQIDCLNTSLKKIWQWSNLWKVDFAPHKCKWLRISLKPARDPPPGKITFGRTDLDEVDSYKLLGIVMQNNTCFDTHVGDTIEKCYKILNFLKRVSGSLNGPRRAVIDLAVKSLIFTKLDYGAEIWYSTLKRATIIRLEDLQYDAAKLVLGAYAGTHKKSLLVELGWLPISERLQWSCAKLFSKLQTLENCTLGGLVEDFLALPVHKAHVFRNLKLSRDLCRTAKSRSTDCLETFGTKQFKTAMKNYLFSKLTDEWNAMLEGSLLRRYKNFWANEKTKLGYRQKWSSRSVEITITRLRLGWNSLNATRKRFRKGTDLCQHCGTREDCDHYFLQCIRYTGPRAKLEHAFASKGIALYTMNCLSLLNIPQQHRHAITTAVEEYITETGRFRLRKFE